MLRNAIVQLVAVLGVGALLGYLAASPKLSELDQAYAGQPLNAVSTNQTEVSNGVQPRMTKLIASLWLWPIRFPALMTRQIQLQINGRDCQPRRCCHSHRRRRPVSPAAQCKSRCTVSVSSRPDCLRMRQHSHCADRRCRAGSGKYLRRVN